METQATAQKAEKVQQQQAKKAAEAKSVTRHLGVRSSQSAAIHFVMSSDQ